MPPCLWCTGYVVCAFSIVRFWYQHAGSVSTAIVVFAVAQMVTVLVRLKREWWPLRNKFFYTVVVRAKMYQSASKTRKWFSVCCALYFGAVCLLCNSPHVTFLLTVGAIFSSCVVVRQVFMLPWLRVTRDGVCSMGFDISVCYRRTCVWRLCNYDLAFVCLKQSGVGMSSDGRVSCCCLFSFSFGRLC